MSWVFFLFQVWLQETYTYMACFCGLQYYFSPEGVGLASLASLLVGHPVRNSSHDTEGIELFGLTF